MNEITNSLHENILKLTDFIKHQKDEGNSSIYVIKDISEICLRGTLSEKDRSYVCSLILRKEDGFLRFLEEAVNTPSLKDSLIEALQFLNSFLIDIGNKVVQYGITVKDVVFSIFLRNQVAKVKILALSALIKVLELCSGTISSEQFNLQKIVNKIIEYLAQASSKISPTVKQQAYYLLGISSRHYPDCMRLCSERLLNWYLKDLKFHTTSNQKSESSIIVGCLQGLNEFMYQFPLQDTEDTEKAYQLFKFIRIILSKRDVKTYDMAKASLMLLSSHASLLAQFLYEDGMNIYNIIEIWTNHSNREVRSLGYNALDAVFKQISDMLEQNYEDSCKAEIFKFFIEKFQLMIKCSENIRRVSTAIRGFGYFAKVCKLYLTEKDVKYMLNDVIKKSEQHCLNEEKILDERIQILPSFLDSLSSIVLQLQEISESSLSYLEKLAVFQIQNFPYLPSPYHFLCYNSLIKLFLAVHSKGPQFKGFLNKIIHQGIIRTCSYPVRFEIEAREENMSGDNLELKNPRDITSKSYSSLWVNLLYIVRNKELNHIGISLEDRHNLLQLIYDEIISVVLTLLKKLDLATTHSMQDGEIKDSNLKQFETSELYSTVSDPFYGLQLSKPKDFRVFMNIVDFFKDLFISRHNELFEKWILIFGLEIIQFINKNPYISGFYKLITVCLTICKKTRYFQHVKKLKTKEEISMSEKDCLIAFELFAKFSREVVIYLQQFKDELLASCIEVILSLPTEIVESEINILIPAVQISLQLGLSYLPLAMSCLDALETWLYSLPSELLKEHYPKLLPSLNDYFLASDNISLQPLKNIHTFTKQSLVVKKKLPLKISQYKKIKQTDLHESELIKVQHRILKFLGSVGNQYNFAMISADKIKIHEVAVAWDINKQNHLKFYLPFVDVKLEIFLDKFLPRIVTLSTTASQRQTKVAACELLHAVVTFMVGCGAEQQPELQARYSMKKLYKNVLPALLQLACDVDEVARKLFEPFTFQLIHWFTTKRMINSDETKQFVQVIWDGLVQSKDAVFRDFSARCLKEFVQWSIKQTSIREQEENPIGMNVVLNCLYNYSLHPNPYKRLGAALAFNSIYTIFREEESLVDKFTLEIAVHFIESLAIAHYDDKILGTQDKCKQALNHLERIMEVKAKLLSKTSKKRRPLRNIDDAVLPEVVEWILKNCGCLQSECRHKCMELVFQLAPCLSGFNECKDYFSHLLETKGKKFFLNCFESEMSNTVPSFNPNDGLKPIINWLEGLHTMLDCYYWVFGQSVLQLSDIFNDASNKESKFFPSIEFFLKTLCIDFDQRVQTFFTHESIKKQILSPKEKDEYLRLNCFIIVRLINFVTTIVENYHLQLNTIPSTFWSINFWNCIYSSVLNPKFLGFDMTDTYIFNQFPKETRTLLKVFCEYMPKPLYNNFNEHLYEYLQSKCNIYNLFPLNLNDKDLKILEIQEMLSGYEQLIENKLWPKQNCNKSKKLACDMLSSVWESCILETEIGCCIPILNPSVLNFGKKILTLALKLDISSEDLLKKLLEEQQLYVSSLKTKTRRGLIMFSTYQQEISLFAGINSRHFIFSLMNNINKSKTTVLKILVGILDSIGKVKEFRHRYGKDIINSIMCQWSRLQQCLEESCDIDLQNDIITLITKIFLIDSSFIKGSVNYDSNSIFFSFITLLQKSEMSLEFKISVLDLLPFFLCDAFLCKVQAALNDLFTNHFPLYSSELKPGSSQYNDYHLAFKKLLIALELTGNEMLLKFVIQIMCRESTHLLEENIQKCFKKLCKRTDPNKERLIAEVPLKMFLEDGLYPSDMRIHIMERVCRVILGMISKTTLKYFFIDHIKEIMQIVKSKRKSSNEIQLVSKIGAFQLIEILYTYLSKEEVSKESQINCSYGQELTREATGSAIAARKENLEGESISKELCRKYCCAAYNAVIAIICCTQTDSKFYSTFLFQENFAKGEYIWENIIDLNKEYTFPIELDTIERRRKFISVRHENRELNSNKTLNFASSLKYAPSQYLSGSSLSDDVSQFDFSSSELAFSQDMKNKNRKEEIDSNPSNEAKDNDLVSNITVELEIDDLNQHECMNSLTMLVQHMEKIQILSSEPKEIPKWLDNLCKKLEDYSVHRNVKLFLTKLFINNAEIFKPYAAFLLQPLINLILNATFGREINYFILDLMVVLLSWSSIAIPEDSSIGRHAASGLLEFLMSKCFHIRKDVFRNNLEMIKTVVQCWKEQLDIPTHIIFESMRNLDTKVKDNIVGIQLFGIVVSNGLDPYQNTSRIDKISLLKTLTVNLKNKYKEIYESASEVCGMSMKYYFDKDDDIYSEFCKIVKTEISSLNAKGQYLTCLYKINTHFPLFIDSTFLNKILYMLPNVHGIFRKQILEIINSHVENIENAFAELKNQGLLNMLEHRDESIQFNSLNILQKLLKELDTDKMLNVFPIISKVHKSAETICRKVMYEIMMHAYEKFNTKNGIKEKEISRYAKEMLLYGLADSDLTLRLTVHNFWSQNNHLPAETFSRIKAVLQKMYSPEIEHMFLQYSTFLLMEMTSKSPDYNLKIFQNPLSTCAFQNYAISSSWKKRHATLTPWFVDSLSSATSFSETSVKNIDEQIRSTVDVREFDPTQEQASKKAFNWLTQTSIDTLGDWGSSSTSSSLLFTIGSDTKKIPNRDEKNRNSNQDTSKNKIEKLSSSNTFHLRRRFLKDREKTRLHFIRMEMRKQQLRQEREKEQKKQREGQVTIYRQYRIGDLPDIEINYSSIIVPLQALAQHDDEICRMLFQSLISSVCCYMKSNIVTEYSEFCRSLSSALNEILKKSIHYHPQLVAFCHECLNCDVKEMDIDYEQISTSSQASHKQSLGILLLEDHLICYNNFKSSNPAKRIKLNKPLISDELSIWLKMAEIYKSLSDYDSVHGIFSNSLNIQEETKQALEFESRGEYLSAVKIYSKLYDQTEWSAEEPNQAEIDLWDNAILQCYDYLTQWDLLQLSIINRLDEHQKQPNLNKIWEEPYYQEHYLPFLIKSKLKLLIENRNDQSLLCFIDSALKEENKKKYLEENFSEELTLLYIIQENYDRAQYYSQLCLQNFLKEWSSLNVLMPVIRKTKLQSLQKHIELQEFLNFIDTYRNIDEYHFKNLTDRWLKRYPDIFDSVNIWDDIIMNRSLYMEKIVSKLQETNNQSTSFSLEESMDTSIVDSEPNSYFDSEKFLKEQRLKMKLKFVEAALLQGNLQVAVKHLKWSQQIAKELKADHHWINCIHLYCKIDLKKAKNQNYPEQLDTLLCAHKQLAKLDLHFPKKLDVSTMNHYLLQSEIIEMAADIVKYNDVHAEKIQELTDTFSIQSKSKLEIDLFCKNYEYKCRAIDIIQEVEQKMIEFDQATIGETYLKFANYCNKILRMQEEEEKTLSLSFETYPSVLTNSLLNALKNGNLNAIKLFPRLLQIIEVYPDTIPEFIAKSKVVPCWMFLSWITQLLTLLDKPEATAVQYIIKEIGTNFPNALVYPFKLSYETYKFPDSLQGKENKEFVMKLKSSLSQLKLVDEFVNALDSLSVPELLYKEYFKEILQMKKDKGDKNEIVKLYKKLCHELFNYNPRDKMKERKLHLKVAKVCGSVVFSEFGKDGNKLISMSLKEASVKYESLLKKITAISEMNKEAKLRDFSDWLSEFHSIKYSEDIEIPGQYTGKRKPIPEHHVKICNFDQKVDILSSLTKPRCLTIRGNDQKDYKFLVKSGEDLRQDNRIEQLFDVMNDIYQCNAVCFQNKLRLETYQVIPLTTKIGLIEWVDNTNVLGSFLKDAMTDKEKESFRESDPKITFYKFLLSKINSRDKSIPLLYENIYKIADTEVNKKFIECINMIPWDLFRRAFLKFSSSLEAFVILRYNFITSHAVLCISQWLLGIGDRHTGNFLVSTTTGIEVGIDFGHAFGTATQFLPIPELVPFRLTNQYLNLMLPLKEKGVIEATMISALSALRNNADILLNTMDIFIKEPTVNWQENALKQKRIIGKVDENVDSDINVYPGNTESDDPNHSECDFNWYPKQRILFAKRKLEGINPCYITKDELRLGHSNKPIFQRFTDVCLGDRKSLRQNLPKNGLSVKQQVKSLIDQATDSRILSRIYFGWDPWF
ncbi:DNA-dependent protein kinase catalytic subunit-like [Centruroides vittatus]|uniref:DNA-dependent protein kinase catalytic subunit-like n=1 Tax=Centruroides vittatus TaxID=120091 RepID=UPI0035105B8F